jgi:hypothetical protein
MRGAQRTYLEPMHILQQDIAWLVTDVVEQVQNMQEAACPRVLGTALQPCRVVTEVPA